MGKAKTKKQPATKNAPRSQGAKAIGAKAKPWPETLQGKEYGGDATRARLAEAMKAIGEMPVAGVIADEYRVAITVTCSNCSADVGELCVGMVGRGRNRKPVVCFYAHQERISAGETAKQFIDNHIAKHGPATAGRPSAKPSNANQARPGNDVVGPTTYPANTYVNVRWEKEGSPKRGLLVRWNGAGNPVVRIARVDPKGEYTGEYGSDRVMVPGDIIGRAAAFVCEAKGDGTCATHAEPMLCAHACGLGACNLGCEDRTDHELRAPEPARKSSTRKPPKIDSAAPRVSVMCKIAGCPARVDDSVLPPDWVTVDGYIYCPPHGTTGARIGQEVAKMKQATADLIAKGAADPAADPDPWDDTMTTPIADMERAMASVSPTAPETPTAIGNAPTLVDAKKATRKRAASRAADRDAATPAQIAHTLPASWCAYVVPAPRDAEPEKCIKVFHGAALPPGWIEGQIDGKRVHFCPGHQQHGIDRLAATLRNEDAPDPIRDARREAGMVEAGIVALERTAGGGTIAPSKYDVIGACGDPSCRARFYTRMPSDWEWWDRAFWCPNHLPADLRDMIGKIKSASDAVDALPASLPEPDPWDEPADVAASSSDADADPWDEPSRNATSHIERDPWDEVA